MSPNYSRDFTAPASQALGGNIKVAVLAESIDALNGTAQASQIALDTIQSYFLSHPTDDVAQAITSAITAANAAILEKQRQDAALAQMGTSILIAVITGERLFVGGVGDGRVYLVREKNIKKVLTGRTWLHEAQASWKAAPGDLPEDPTSHPPKDYLGKAETVAPDLQPIELLWPGDIILICTSRLASHLREDQIRDILVSRPGNQAAFKLVDAALELGAEGNLTAMVVAVPEPVKTSFALPAGLGRMIPRAVVALIIVNLLVAVVIAFLLVNGALAPAPAVEVAVPAFVPTATPAATDNPQALGPGVAPAAAPSLTPAPTLTPIALAANWDPPALSTPQVPANGFVFTGPDAPVILAWDSVGNLPEDVYYVVTIRKWVNDKLIGESRNWTKSNRIKLDPSFYFALYSGTRSVGMSAPLLNAADARFEWFITLYRWTTTKPDGAFDGVPVGTPSPVVTFFWRAPVQQAPTRVYGSQNLDTDPFFSEEKRREASVAGVSSPVSAGMAVFSLVLSSMAGWPKFRAKLRKRSGPRL